LRIAFVSIIPEPWGGSEELWYRTAKVLRARGIDVAFGVRPWPEPVRQIRDLIDVGCEPHWHPYPGLLRRVLIRAGSSNEGALDWLRRSRPDLVVSSVAMHAANLDVDAYLHQHALPYLRLVQLASDSWWPTDGVLDLLTRAYTRAAACCFVSDANRRMVERQLGVELPNACVVANPYNVRRDLAVPWPSAQGPLRLACVGRLDPPSKGQDLLLEVLAQPRWRERAVTLDVFGKGASENVLRRLASFLGLDESRVRFRGFASDIEQVWAEHHALVMPSRMEGTPLAAVEAMLCGRVPILTAVSGNTELVEDGETGFLAEAPTVRHLADAMERAWARRSEWPAIGARAADAIRRLIPRDPATDLADRIVDLCTRRASNLGS
jgi:glycosyltransferase involved in cell wall biosynthesis